MVSRVLRSVSGAGEKFLLPVLCMILSVFSIPAIGYSGAQEPGVFIYYAGVFDGLCGVLEGENSKPENELPGFCQGDQGILHGLALKTLQDTALKTGFQDREITDTEMPSSYFFSDPQLVNEKLKDLHSLSGKVAITQLKLAFFTLDRVLTFKQAVAQVEGHTLFRRAVYLLVNFYILDYSKAVVIYSHPFVVAIEGKETESDDSLEILKKSFASTGFVAQELKAAQTLQQFSERILHDEILKKTLYRGSFEAESFYFGVEVKVNDKKMPQLMSTTGKPLTGPTVTIEHPEDFRMVASYALASRLAAEVPLIPSSVVEDVLQGRESSAGRSIMGIVKSAKLQKDIKIFLKEEEREVEEEDGPAIQGGYLDGGKWLRSKYFFPRHLGNFSGRVDAVEVKLVERQFLQSDLFAVQVCADLEKMYWDRKTNRLEGRETFPVQAGKKRLCFQQKTTYDHDNKFSVSDVFLYNNLLNIAADQGPVLKDHYDLEQFIWF